MLRRLLSAQLVLLLLLAVVAVPASAQSVERSVDIVQANITEHPTVRLAVDVGSNSFSADNLAITENGVPVDFELESVSAIAADYPMAILVDAHPDRVAEAQALAGVLIGKKNPADRIRLVPIDANPGSQISTQSEILLNIEANSIAPSEQTRLFDALNRLPKLFGTDITPQVFIITSGVDTDSSVEKAEALAAIDSMDVTVIALSGGEPDPGILQQIGDRIISGGDRAAVESAMVTADRPQINRVVVAFESTVRLAEELSFDVSYLEASTAINVLVPNVEEETLVESFATFEPQLSVPLVANPEHRTWFGVGAVAAAAIAAALIGWVVFESYRNSQAALSRRLESYVSKSNVEEAEEDSGTILGKLPGFGLLSQRAEGFASDRGLMQPISNLLESANLPWRPGEAVAFALTSSVIIALAVGLWVESIAAGLLTAVALVAVVYVVVNQIAARDRKKFEEQLPSVLGLLATSLRSGQSFLQAMEAVAAEAPQPTAREYNRAVAEVRLGRTVGSAMSGISQRMNSSDFEWVVMSTEIQREVGGNLAEVLDIVSDTMLQRTRLRREVRALSAEGRFSAGILLLMPIFLVMFLYVNNRPYLMQLTASTTGWILVGVCLGLMAGAIAWVRKIVDIEV